MKKNTSFGTPKTSTVAKIFKYMKSYSWLFFLSVLLAVISTVLTLFIPRFIGKAIDLCVDKGNVDLVGMMPYLIYIAVSAGLIALCQLLMSFLGNKMTFGIVKNLRKDAFDRLQSLPVSYVDTHGVGETVSRIISDTDRFTDGLLMGFTQFLTGVLTIVGTLVFMLRLDFIVAIVVVVLTPLSLFVAGQIASRSHKLFKLQAEANAREASFAEEMITNHKVVTAFSHEDETVRDFDTLNSELERHSRKATFVSSLTNPSTRFINNIVYASVAFTGAFISLRYGDARLSVGTLSTLLGYANQYAKPFNEISGVVTELQNSLACAERVFELIDSIPESTEGEDEQLPDTVSGEVEFSGVSFSYTHDKPLIEGLDLYVAKGKRIAIVGPTGCGKTTLINLLMRFYDVTDGHISVDSTPIDRVNRQSLRASWGMVLQDTWLSEGSVRDNITFGKPDATDEEIIAAAKASHAHSFIKRLKNGYDTVLGEDGGSLSQGQKQLLCITRVMLSIPPMLILDEATSSIDTRTEQKIQKAFSTMMKGRTSFIVAHRLSTIKDADIILVMRDGKVIEQGDHETLLKQGGFYSELYNSQLD